ncbi:sugar/nucleoside kinase (ribokinase family) [Kaistia hirudinis]|uniref:Sugar/nucleoside kinase (Ribokinase family) n=1 Tax=Kaistia hirudinis TaxID=1293440 RepID=A0A840AMD5_9HYPH|nr:PfkB family carbohydrate kinase [Kaistia hirudinis]MBB3930197.1 sugar/nucleoside kinase (ribokinase family) [Kaistia hirudinis]
MSRIYCLSTVDLDRVFEIDHLPAHDEKMFASSYREVAGGQGVFTARALAALHAPVTFVGTVGDDLTGTFLIEEMKRVAGLEVAIERLPGVASGSCVILVDKTGEKAIVLAPIHGDLVTRLGETLSVAPGDLVTCNFFDPAAIQRLFARVRAEGGLSLIDMEFTGIRIHGWDATFATAATADVICTNKTALAAWCEREIVSGTLLDRAEALAQALSGGTRRVCVTLGGDGVLVHEGGRSVHVPALPIRPANTTGAGDTFLAGIAFALARGDRFVDAAGLATRVAADFLVHGHVDPARAGV